VIFTFDANPGATRTGTLTIAGQTLTVTQAGSTYVSAATLGTLASSGLNQPTSAAVDGAGNVYIADTGNNAIKEWIAASNAVTTLVSSGLSSPRGVAVDGAGNVYITDPGHSAIKEWIAASNTVTTLISSGLNQPSGVAVDGAGNIYIADSGNNAIKEWIAASNTVVTLLSSGLNAPSGVAVDGAGNVYIADSGNQVIKKWMIASDTVTTLVPSGLSSPSGVAVDGAGNVYIADTAHSSIKEWVAASNNVATLIPSGLLFPRGVAIDGAGNVYITYSPLNMILQLPHAFVDSTAKAETAMAVNDTLPVVLPATANLTGPFTPFSDSVWLTITTVTNGVVSFALTTNTSTTNRTAKITLLGQTIAITQVAVQQPILSSFTMLGNSAFQFGFTNNQGASFTIWATTNLSLPLTNWTMLGTATNNGSGFYNFIDLTATNGGQRFYRVSFP
jgi:DNA-binding beta-propeller fold protein YncE